MLSAADICTCPPCTAGRAVSAAPLKLRAPTVSASIGSLSWGELTRFASCGVGASNLCPPVRPPQTACTPRVTAAYLNIPAGSFYNCARKV